MGSQNLNYYTMFSLIDKVGRGVGEIYKDLIFSYS